MKKLLALFLSLAMVLSMSSTSFAADASSSTSKAGIMGTVVHEEIVPISANYQTLSINTDQASGLSIMSYVENEDGSFTTYQYLNGILTDEHTTTPGSGIVEHTYYNVDGTCTQSTENVAAEQGIISPEMLRGAQASIRDMGYMHYKHHYTGTIYSISVEVYDRFYQNSSYRFGQGTAKTLAEWTNTLLSVWSYSVNPMTILSGTIGFLSATGLLQAGLNGVYTVLVTRVVSCDYSNQTFYGTATAPSSNYPEGILEGTYAVIHDNGQSKIIREGYTVSGWGTSPFGRAMMYKVFSIDEAPTSWTKL